jgi:hypothetical protein
MDLPEEDNAHSSDEKTAVFTPGTITLLTTKVLICFQEPIIPYLSVASYGNIIIPFFGCCGLFFYGI